MKFLTFSNTTPRTSFFDDPSANLASKTCFGSHLRSQLDPFCALEAQLLSKKAPKGWGTPSEGERLGAHLAAFWCRKGPK